VSCVACQGGPRNERLRLNSGEWPSDVFVQFGVLQSHMACPCCWIDENRMDKRPVWVCIVIGGLGVILSDAGIAQQCLSQLRLEVGWPSHCATRDCTELPFPPDAASPGSVQVASGDDARQHEVLGMVKCP
jgi:hypothetical protein